VGGGWCGYLCVTNSAAVAAVAAVASLTLIRGRDFAAVPAAPGTAGAHQAAAEPRDDIPADHQESR
jgi:hypothetical protein